MTVRIIRPPDVYSLKGMGLARVGPHLFWAFNHKGHLRWAPHWVRRTIMRVWNRIACWRYGHSSVVWFAEDPSPQCTVCSKWLPKSHPHAFINGTHVLRKEN